MASGTARVGRWFLIPTTAFLIPAVMGLPLPPLFSKVGTIHSAAASRHEFAAWTASGHAFRFAYSTWIWAALALAFGGIAMTLLLWPAMRNWIAAHPFAFRIGLAPIAFAPSACAVAVLPLVIAMNGGSQSNYVHQTWSVSVLLAYGATFFAAYVAICALVMCISSDYWRSLAND